METRLQATCKRAFTEREKRKKKTMGVSQWCITGSIIKRRKKTDSLARRRERITAVFKKSEEKKKSGVGVPQTLIIKIQ